MLRYFFFILFFFIFSGDPAPFLPPPPPQTCGEGGAAHIVGWVSIFFFSVVSLPLESGGLPLSLETGRYPSHYKTKIWVNLFYIQSFPLNTPLPSPSPPANLPLQYCRVPTLQYCRGGGEGEGGGRGFIVFVSPPAVLQGGGTVKKNWLAKLALPLR